MLVIICVLYLSLFGNSNDASVSTSDPVEYRLLAANKTSTIQKELGAAGEAGFLYAGQTIYDSAFSGRKVVIILERSDGDKAIYEYKLLGTTLPSTMQKEISEAGRAGFLFSGITVAETDYGGREMVSILQRRVGFVNSGTTILR